MPIGACRRTRRSSASWRSGGDLLRRCSRGHGRRARRGRRWTSRRRSRCNPIMPGVKMVEALAQCGAVAVLSQPENRGKLVALRRHRRRALQADRPSGRRARPRLRGGDGPRPDRQGQGARDGRRRARRARHADLRGGRMISRDERPADLDHGPRLPRAGARGHERRARRRSSTRTTSGSVDRTGIRERRVAADHEAMSDLSLPAARKALEMAGVDAARASTS